jgi:hypothetical protein
VISQLGIQPFGPTGPFSLPGKISVLGVVPLAENRLIVCWDIPPNIRDRKGARSAINVGNYTLTPIDPTIETEEGPVVPPGELVPTFEVDLWRAEVDEVDLTQIHLWTDRNLDPGRRYNLVIDGPIDGAANCEEHAGPIDWRIKAPLAPKRRPANPAAIAELLDLHDGLVPEEEIDTVWHYTADGDIDVQSSSSALRKTIYRMLSSMQGEWKYHPSFGVYIPLKTATRGDVVQRSANSIRATLSTDPLVRDAFVQAAVEIVGADAVIRFTISVFRRDERRLDTIVDIPVIQL